MDPHASLQTAGSKVDSKSHPHFNLRASQLDRWMPFKALYKLEIMHLAAEACLLAGAATSRSSLPKQPGPLAGKFGGRTQHPGGPRRAALALLPRGWYLLQPFGIRKTLVLPGGWKRQGYGSEWFLRCADQSGKISGGGGKSFQVDLKRFCCSSSSLLPRTSNQKKLITEHGTNSSSFGQAVFFTVNFKDFCCCCPDQGFSCIFLRNSLSFSWEKEEPEIFHSCVNLKRFLPSFLHPSLLSAFPPGAAPTPQRLMSD